MEYVEAYVFGDRFQAPEFKQAVFQKLVQSPPERPILSNHRIHLPPPKDDILLDLLVDIPCPWYKSENDTEQEVEDSKKLPHDSLTRLILRHSWHWPKPPFEWSKYRPEHKEAQDDNMKQT